MRALRRSRRRRNAVISGNASFPVLDGYGDTGLSAMELPCNGMLTVPSFANYTWGPEVTVTAYVTQPCMPAHGTPPLCWGWLLHRRGLAP
jgi:hypothetical protein